MRNSLKDVTIRPAERGDMNFVYSSWLSAVATSEKRRTPKNLVYKHHRPIMERALEESRVVVACMEDCHDQILGWLCHDGDIVHYLYIKQSFRGFGLATLLINEVGIPTPITVTHWTWRLWDISKTHSLVYNPYLLAPKGEIDDFKETYPSTTT